MLAMQVVVHVQSAEATLFISMLGRVRFHAIPQQVTLFARSGRYQRALAWATQGGNVRSFLQSMSSRISASTPSCQVVKALEPKSLTFFVDGGKVTVAVVWR